jgi:hypothetical protein
MTTDDNGRLLLGGIEKEEATNKRIRLGVSSEIKRLEEGSRPATRRKYQRSGGKAREFMGKGCQDANTRLASVIIFCHVICL